jgi:hypothetical protein
MDVALAAGLLCGDAVDGDGSGFYGNAKAHQYWPQDKHIQQASQARGIRKGSSGEVELKLQPITAKAVQSALWLSLYGFDNLPQADLIDGAYLRACIVSELHAFNRIFVARPLCEGWPDRGPRNWFEVQDWQTEMWFSAGYKAEVDTLLQINGLIKGGYLTGKFKHVDLVGNCAEPSRRLLPLFH